MPHPELQQEQAYVDHAYDYLDKMRTTLEGAQDRMATEFASRAIEAWMKRRQKTFMDAVRGLCFGPTVLYVLPGTRVTWTNQDPVLHTVTGLGFRWGSGDSLGQGNSISYRFTAPGVYPYSCIIHPGMVGAVVVGDAGSPTAVGLAVPAAVAPPSPSAAAQVAAAAASGTNATVPASSTGGIWRTISIVAMALLVALVVTVGLQRRRSPGLGA